MKHLITTILLLSGLISSSVAGQERLLHKVDNTYISITPNDNLVCVVRQLMTIIAYNSRTKRSKDEVLRDWKNAWTNRYSYTMPPTSYVEIQRVIRDAHRKNNNGQFTKPVDNYTINKYVGIEKAICENNGY